MDQHDVVEKMGIVKRVIDAQLVRQMVLIDRTVRMMEDNHPHWFPASAEVVSQQERVKLAISIINNSRLILQLFRYALIPIIAFIIGLIVKVLGLQF